MFQCYSKRLCCRNCRRPAWAAAAPCPTSQRTRPPAPWTCRRRTRRRRHRRRQWRRRRRRRRRRCRWCGRCAAAPARTCPRSRAAPREASAAAPRTAPPPPASTSAATSPWVPARRPRCSSRPRWATCRSTGWPRRPKASPSPSPPTSPSRRIARRGSARTWRYG